MVNGARGTSTSGYLLAWGPMIPLAILNGAVREAVYKKPLGDLRAHQLSTVTLIALFAGYVGVVTWRWPMASARQALLVGAQWLGLTVAFEFGFGHYVSKQPWSRLLADYDLRAGRVWPLVLLWVFAAPSVFRWLFSGSRGRKR